MEFLLDRDPELNRLKTEIVKYNNNLSSSKKRITGYLSLTSKSQLENLLREKRAVVPVLPPPPIKAGLIKPIKPGECLLPSEEKITTTSAQDYRTVKEGIKEENISLADFKKKYHLGKVLGKGSYGKIYQGKYQSQQVVFKVIQQNPETGFEGFLWECVASKRAAMLGVGPGVVDTIVLKTGKKITHYVIAMNQCTPDEENDLTYENTAEIYAMMKKLHSNGIAHRDLGKRNMMKSGRQFVFIDYGLAFVYDGPVPAEVQLLDHAVLAFDVSEYFEYLVAEEIYTSKKLDTFESDLKADTVSLENFPLPMLRTLREKGEYYLNYTKGGEAVMIARQLKKKIEKI
jgi:tRNA A-37 threonylcarbamoyl transferase component Bud32